MSFAQTNLNKTLKINPSEKMPYRHVRAEIMKPDLHFLGLEKKTVFYDPTSKGTHTHYYGPGVTIITETELYKMEIQHLLLRIFGF
jgi:hypothetical protein